MPQDQILFQELNLSICYDATTTKSFEPYPTLMIPYMSYISTSLSTLPHSPISSSLLPRGRRRPLLFSPLVLPLRWMKSLFSVTLLFRQYVPIHQVLGRTHIFGRYSVALLTIPPFKQRTCAFLTVPQDAIDTMNVCRLLSTMLASSIHS